MVSKDKEPEKDQYQKQVIVDTAHDKFRRFGIRRVTMDEIARDLRLSKKTLYQHFPTKEDLVRACTVRIRAAILPAIAEVMSAPGSTSERLGRVFEAFARLPKLVSGELVADLQADYPHIWRDIDAERRAVFARLEDLVVAGIAAGEIRREIHPRVLRYFFLAVLERVMAPDVLGLGEFTPAEAVQTLITIFGRGLLADSGAARAQEGVS